MTVAERILTMDDAALLRFRDNVRRLQAAPGRQQNEALALAPLIEAEVAVREARKPPKKTAKPTKAALAKKAAAEAKAAAAAEEAEEAEEAEDPNESEAAETETAEPN
ncbi:MAG TPA: hypothetical protein VL460_05260 [Caulobacteraceae bacterium]|jgi:hypothetical protein|nr:hypothetical protein [Caulobacteraceae bacterium]